MKILKNKDILYITHSYNSFQKDPIEIMAKHFKNVYVLVRYKPIAEISKVLPINSLKTHRKEYVIDLKDKPKNVHVYPVLLFYLPTQRAYKNLGEKHYKAVLKQIQKNNIKFDIIHSHFIWTSGYVVMKLKEKFNKPLVITGHGYDVYDLPFRDNEWRSNIEKVLNSANTVTTVSKSNLDKLRELNIKTPIKVIPNGFNSNLFKPMDKEKCKEKLSLPKDKKIILTVGNLLPIKGQKYLIEAMKKIIVKHPKTMCYIVGGGPLKNKLQNQIEKLNLDKNVKLVVKKPHSEIPKWMNAADIFVLPSIRESFGVVQLEAMACGKPVVATINGGSEEVIINDSLGFLVPPRDPEELAKKINLALEKEWNNKKIVEHSAKFTWDNISKQVLEIYKNFL